MVRNVEDGNWSKSQGEREMSKCPYVCMCLGQVSKLRDLETVASIEGNLSRCSCVH